MSNSNEHKSHQGIPKDPGYAKRLNSIVQETAEQVFMIVIHRNNASSHRQLIDIHRQQEQLTAQEIQERSKEYK